MNLKPLAIWQRIGPIIFLAIGIVIGVYAGHYLTLHGWGHTIFPL